MEQKNADKEEYESLRLRLLDEENKVDRETLVHLGAGFSIQAEVDDVDEIYINVGLDVHVSFKSSEALVFLQEKIILLEKESAAIEKEIVIVQNDLTWVCMNER